VTSSLPDGTTEWQGRPVARSIADAATRQRAVLTGVVRAVEVHRRLHPRGRLYPSEPSSAMDAWLDDGTGTITLRWLGREAVGGVVAGATLHVEGTVSSESDRLVILNPLYRFAEPNPPSDRSAPAGAAEPSTASESPAQAPVQGESSTS
jgi:hypothetical protein